MKRYAVIDVGSNSVRLMLVADGKVLYKRLQTTRLGEGLAERPLLKDEAIERSARAVADFYAQALADKAERVYSFATAAARTAENGAAFVKRVDELCGLAVEIVSGEVEAELGISGALGTKDGGVIDVGGASTEIVVRKDGAYAYKKSINIGVVRIKDKYGRNQAQIHEGAKTAVAAFADMPKQKSLVAIGGTATTLASLILGLKEYDSAKVTGAELSVKDLRALSNRLFALSVAEIAAMPCVSKGREDVLAGGAELLATVAEELGIEKLVVSDRDNLEGYAVYQGLQV